MRVLGLILSLLFVRPLIADVGLRRGSVARFASVAEGAEILAHRDDFVQRLSPFDRAARMKTDKFVSEEEFIKFVKANLSSWSDSEKAQVEAAITNIRPALDRVRAPLPPTISLIKTTGAEEGNAFYTRDRAVVIPASKLPGAPAELLAKMIAHELFHILSRENSELREKLYRLIGFNKCAEVEFPLELRSRKITNPDAPRNDHSILLHAGTDKVTAVPILFSKSEKYDVRRGGEFFDYLEFKFLLVQKNGVSLAKPEPVAPEDVTGFFEQAGRNTNYIIHPEEILADNFALLILSEWKIPSPEILQKMENVLMQR